MDKQFKSGFVSLIGRPNVGKSTLMNNLLGEKLAIISNKPQTTRNRIHGILTDDQSQIIFMDTPGLHSPKSKLGESMVKSAEQAYGEADLVLLLITPELGSRIHHGDEPVIERLKKVKAPIFLVINKIDTVDKPSLLQVIDAYKSQLDFAEIVPVSALKAENTTELLSLIKQRIPEGPMYFPGDSITDQPERFIAAEIIREKALYLLQDEVPHGIAVEVEKFKERDGAKADILDIEANIYCERNSHKGIIIGKQGAMLKQLGTMARRDLERLFAIKVNLKLWVKVKKDWRDSDFYLKNFGYEDKI